MLLARSMLGNTDFMTDKTGLRRFILDEQPFFKLQPFVGSHIICIVCVMLFSVTYYVYVHMCVVLSTLRQ